MPDSIRTSRVQHFAVSGAALALALCAAAAAIPQQNSEVSQESKSSTVIRATTRVVNVSLVATDAQGNPVKDLAKSEVTILDEGKPQVISFFSAVDDTQLLPAGPAPGPDTYTNLPTGRAEPPSATILLFDALNSRWTSQGYGLERVRKFLRQIEPEDHIGLYVLSDDLKVLHDFRDDASDLVRAMDRYDDEHGKVPRQEQATAKQSGSDDAALDRFLSGKDNRYRFALDNLNRSALNVTGVPRPVPGPGATGYVTDKLTFARQMTIASLEQIARQLSSVAGRKSLIWVTDAVQYPLITAYYSDEPPQLGRKNQNARVPTFLRGNGDDVERMARLMNEAGVAVYPVSAEGLETEDLGFKNTCGPVPCTATSINSPRPDVNPAARINTGIVTADLRARLPDPSQHMAMEMLASRTGGRAYFNRNDLETGVRRALDDARFNYSLAYYPDHNSWIGEWRKIEVKVDRPGVKVLARNGYFALPDARPMAPKSRFEFLSGLAASPLDSPQLPMSAHIAASSDSKGRRLHAQVRLNPVSMLALQDDGKWKGSFEVVFMQMGKNNKLLDLTVKSVDAELSEEEYADAAKEGYQLPANLKFMPGAEELCVILRDGLSDAAGSVHIPLERYAASLGSH